MITHNIINTADPIIKVNGPVFSNKTPAMRLKSTMNKKPTTMSPMENAIPLIMSVSVINFIEGRGGQTFIINNVTLLNS
ncbi:MAG: hypothetical protein GY721_01450 [Deltaproteobacteria bacterium]|nr:hypothetical protein [Deltaproteobacteria bacterium]